MDNSAQTKLLRNYKQAFESNAVANTDGGGKVSVKESFAAADTDGDGVISLEEYSRPGLVPPDSTFGTP